MDVLVVHRLRVHVAAALPAVARIERREDRHAAGRRLDLGVDQALLRGRERDHDAAHVAAGDALADPAPGLAAVGGLVQPALGSAVDQRPGVTAALMRHRQQHVGVGRIHRDIADAGVLADLEDLRPVLAAVDRLVEPAVAARRPQRTVGGREHDVRIARIDDDAADVLGGLEAQIPPRAAGVVAAIDAVAVADAALVVGLAAAHPDRGRVLRIDDDRSHRVGPFVLEDRRPGDAGVGRLPHAARCDADIPRLLVAGMNGDVADAARHHRRTNRAQAEA